jgi:Arc/MetJ family transcription regulator
VQREARGRCLPVIRRSPPRLDQVIFKGVGDGRPYPDHALTLAEWATVAPRQVRLADLVTTKRTLDLETLLDEQSTFYGDLFAHVVKWQGVLYLEDGLHRALRTALHGRPVLHARVLDLDDPAAPRGSAGTTRGGTR